jgi:WD40 repeat protein
VNRNIAVMRRLSKLAFYFVSAFTAVLLVLIGLFGQRCASVPISSVAFRPDGQEMLVVKLDGQVERWGGWPERAEYLYTTGHTGYINSIVFSPDGKIIATASDDTSLRLWDVQTGMPLRIFYAAANSIYPDMERLQRVQFVNNGRIVCGSTKDKLVLWDFNSGTIIRKFEAAGPKSQCSFDGKTAVIDRYARVEIRDIQTGSVLHTLDHQSRVENLEISPNGKVILTETISGISTWDLDSGMLLTFFAKDQGKWWNGVLAITPDSNHFLYAHGNQIRLLDIVSGEVQLTITVNEWVFGMSFTPDGESVWVNTFGAIYQFDTRTGKELQRLATSQYLGTRFYISVLAIAVSSDGSQVAAASDDKRIWIWNVQSGKLLNRLYGHTASVCTAAYTPDGQGLLTGGNDQAALLWDLQTGKSLHIFEQHWDGITNVGISPDGKLAITFGHSSNLSHGDVILWDLQTGKRLKTFTTTPITSAILSPNGSDLATVSMGGTLSLWDLQTGVRILYGPSTDPSVEPYEKISKIAFSPDGKLIALGGKRTVRILRLEATSIVSEYDVEETYSTNVTGLAFSPDGSTLAATFAGTGNQIYLWDTEGKLLKRMSHPGAHLTSLAFSPDGKTILTGSADGIPRLWDVDTGTPQRVLCPNIISRRYSAGGWIGLLALIIVPLRAFRRYRTDSLKTPVV